MGVDSGFSPRGTKLLLGAGAFRGHTWCKPGKQGRCVPCPEPKSRDKVSLAMRKGDRIASPLWVGFDGKTLRHLAIAWLANGSVGGVVLFARNIDTPAQVRGLCREIRSAAGRANPLPLIAVDQEGGRVARFRNPPFTWFPPARACSRFGRRNGSWRSRRRGDRRGAAGGGDRRGLRPGARRRQQSGQPGDRGSGPFRSPAERGRSRDRVRHGSMSRGILPGRETFSGARRHVRRLPPGAAGRPAAGRRSFAANCSPSAARCARGSRRS